MESTLEASLLGSPFLAASPQEIILMGERVLPKSTAEHDYWRERTLSAWTALTHALCWIRDNEAMTLSVEVFQNHLALAKFQDLYDQGYSLAQANAGVWPHPFISLEKYMRSLNGFSDALANKKSTASIELPESTWRAHGERTMQLDYVLRRLGGMPAYI
jgi:hypothetical protein